MVPKIGRMRVMGKECARREREERNVEDGGYDRSSPRGRGSRVREGGL